MDKDLAYLLARYTFHSIEDSGDLVKVLDDLLLLTNLINSNRRLYLVLDHPCIANIAKIRIGQMITDSEILQKALNVLIVTKRIEYLNDFARYFKLMVHAKFDIQVAEITTAEHLDRQTVLRLVQALIDRTNKLIEFKVHIDPNIIGGLRVKIGDMLLDNTIQHTLNTLEKRMLSYES